MRRSVDTTPEAAPGPRLAPSFFLVFMTGVAASPLLFAGDARICDDFEDGVLPDDNPACWEAPCSWFGPPPVLEQFGVSDGELVLRRRDPFDLYLLLCDSVAGDAAFRVQAGFRGSVNDNTRVSILAYHDCMSGYQASLRANGELRVVILDNGRWKSLGLVFIPNFDGRRDYMLEVEVQGELMEFRAWPCSEPAPATPAISTMDASLRSGRFGVGFHHANSPASGSFTSVEFTDAPPLSRSETTCDHQCSASSSQFLRGDVDGNGILEITDVVNDLEFQFLGTYPPRCLDAHDFDDNGLNEITDGVNSLGHQFLGHAPPPAPGTETCGEDPTDDNLDCEAYPQERCN